MEPAPEQPRDVVYPGGKVRLFVPDALAADAALRLSGEQSHYLLHVMRAEPGGRVSLFNGRDGEWSAVLEPAGKRALAARCAAQTRAQAGVPDLWLLFAPLKRAPIDYLAQKAAELGVAGLQPVITRRTVAARVNVERLRANVIEAAEQSGRLTVPEVREPLTLARALEAGGEDRTLIFCDEAGDARPIAQALEGARGPAAVLIGPEGGFDPTERELIRARKNTVAVTLGPRIVRADTAALAALAVWQAVAGDWQG